MALEPMAYVQKIYAGFLGMNIGIRLGAPVEPGLWSYERIRDTYGDIRSYVKDYKHFAADDDANGPVFFLRALDDHAGEPTAQAVAEAWLNYAREGTHCRASHLRRCSRRGIAETLDATPEWSPPDRGAACRNAISGRPRPNSPHP